MKYFAPKPPGSDARASQSQNTFFREIGICVEKCAYRVIPTLDQKTVDILLKALQIAFPTQKSDPKSVKRFPSYCSKTLPFFVDHQICKCINFFVSQPIFFNDPSKFVYCKGACSDEARFLILGLGAVKIEKNYPFFCL